MWLSGRIFVLRRLLLILRQTISDVIIVTLVGDEDVHTQLCIGGLVESAHGYRDPAEVRRIKKQRRTAFRAKAAPDLFGGLVPGQVLTAVDCQCFLFHIGGCKIVAGMFAALGAMAGVGSWQIALDFEPHRVAKARPFVHHLLLDGFRK